MLVSQARIQTLNFGHRNIGVGAESRWLKAVAERRAQLASQGIQPAKPHRNLLTRLLKSLIGALGSQMK